MTQKSIRSTWSDPIARDLQGMLEVSRWNPFEGWEQNAQPGGSAEEELRLAIDLLVGFHLEKDAERCLNNCLAIADRAFAEKESAFLNDELKKHSWPQQRAELSRSRSYALALLGQPLRNEDLRHASLDMEDLSQPLDGIWDSQNQSYYLDAVRLALMADDHDHVASLLKTRRSFNWHQEQWVLLQALAAGGSPPGTASLDQLDRYFERIRDPNFRPDVYMNLTIERIEWAVFRWHYFTHVNQPVDWRKAVMAIAD